MSSTSGRSGPSQQGERMDRHGWDLRYQAQERVFGADPSGFLGPEVGPLVPGRALDLGCGEGRNALWLAERGWTVTGIDHSSVGVAMAATWPADVACGSTGWSPT
jgi:2-polyprenyl-3-methyl-5-hydroxy-6-metoxy-1,4-benzoquinol methylase